MKKPVWLLPLFMAATLAAIYFLPKVGAVAESAVNMDLPYRSGIWSFNHVQASEDEIKTLAEDTKFSKAICTSPRAYDITDWGDLARDRVDMSIVLSGADINNSIHRPERCMPAQGHHITGESGQMLELSNGHKLPVKRLVSVQLVPLKPREGEDPKKVVRSMKLNCVTYYFFVGHDHVSNDHLERTLVDMKDRLVHGMDQRWAYISASMWYGNNVPGIGGEVSEAEADAKLRGFLTDFAEKQINWDQIRM